MARKARLSGDASPMPAIAAKSAADVRKILPPSFPALPRSIEKIVAVRFGKSTPS
jgi:hypothetical protein